MTSLETIKRLGKSSLSLITRYLSLKKLESMSFASTLLIVLAFRSFLFQPFLIPSESMMPTLLVGDFIISTKWSYGYDDVSLPFSPSIFSKRVFKKTPTQGDVIIFRGPAGPNLGYPEDTKSLGVVALELLDYATYLVKKALNFFYLAGAPDFPKEDGGKDYVKRLVGLPGDRIQMIDGHLHINGEKLPLEKKEPFYTNDPHGSIRIVDQYIETLPNGITHPILKRNPFGSALSTWDNTDEFMVPNDHVFAMGDNRDDSWDSRDLNFIGFIPMRKLIAKGQFIWFSTGGSTLMSFVDSIRPSRIGFIYNDVPGWLNLLFQLMVFSFFGYGIVNFFRWMFKKELKK
jgi:signal peptidase I